MRTCATIVTFVVTILCVPLAAYESTFRDEPYSLENLNVELASFFSRLHGGQLRTCRGLGMPLVPLRSDQVPGWKELQWIELFGAENVESFGRRPRVHEVADGVYSYVVLISHSTAKESLASLDETGCSPAFVDVPTGLHVLDIHVSWHGTEQAKGRTATEAVVTCGQEGASIKKRFSRNADKATDFAVCTPPVFEEHWKVNWLWVVAFLEHYAALGVKHFYVYRDSVKPPPEHIAERIKSLEIKIDWIDVGYLPGKSCTWYNAQVFTIYDCWLRSRANQAIRWSLFLDLDEFLHISQDETIRDFRDVSKNASSSQALDLHDVATAIEKHGIGAMTIGSKEISEARVCREIETQEMRPWPVAPPNLIEEGPASLQPMLDYFSACLLHEALVTISPKCRNKRFERCQKDPPRDRKCSTNAVCVSSPGHRKYMLRPEAVSCDYTVPLCFEVHFLGLDKESFAALRSQPGCGYKHSYADAIWLDHFHGLLTQGMKKAAWTC